MFWTSLSRRCLGFANREAADHLKSASERCCRNHVEKGICQWLVPPLFSTFVDVLVEFAYYV